jgi:hypothetical protein
VSQHQPSPQSRCEVVLRTDGAICLALSGELDADARAREDGSRLVVARPPGCVRRLLELTNLVGRLTIDDRLVADGAA